MSSPARRHFDETAASLAAQAEGMDLAQLTVYQRLQRQLQGDKTILKSLAGVSDKVKAKAGMLSNYEDWIKGVMESGAVAEDDKVTPTVLVWMIDCGLLDEAMPLATFAMSHNMQSADEYQRTMPEIIVEQYAEQMSAGAAISPDNLKILIDWATAKNDSGLHQHNMPDQIRAKLLKAAGEQAEEESKAEEALRLYRLAVGYNEKAGVKKRIDALEKQLKAAQ